jgi:hypothetical protein
MRGTKRLNTLVNPIVQEVDLTFVISIHMKIKQGRVLLGAFYL